MTGRRQNVPKGSEIPTKIWLEQIEMKKIMFVGLDGEGPPDFTGEYLEEKIAVEACLLYDKSVWGRTIETAVKEMLESLIREVGSEEGIGIHWLVEYDEQDRPPKNTDRKSLKKQIKAVVRSVKSDGMWGREFSIRAQDKSDGRGITLVPVGQATNETTISGWGADTGQILYGDELGMQIGALVSEKARKVRKSERARAFDRWWLILDDEVTFAMDILSPGSEPALLKHIREAEGFEMWSKIVLLSRMRDTVLPPDSPLWFKPLWEDPRCPPLPVSPSPAEPYVFRL